MDDCLKWPLSVCYIHNSNTLLSKVSNMILPVHPGGQRSRSSWSHYREEGEGLKGAFKCSRDILYVCFPFKLPSVMFKVLKFIALLWGSTIFQNTDTYCVIHVWVCMVQRFFLVCLCSEIQTKQVLNMF